MDASGGQIAIFMLDNDEVVVGPGGHLCQVGYDDHLRGTRQPGQPTSDFQPDSPANPGVNLVKNKGLATLICVCQDNLKG